MDSWCSLPSILALDTAFLVTANEASAISSDLNLPHESWLVCSERTALMYRRLQACTSNVQAGVSRWAIPIHSEADSLARAWRTSRLMLRFIELYSALVYHSSFLSSCRSISWSCNVSANSKSHNVMVALEREAYDQFRRHVSEWWLQCSILCCAHLIMIQSSKRKFSKLSSWVSWPD